jgi:hypothetical protein
MWCLAALPLITAASCGKRTVEHLPTPPERLVCTAAGPRPQIPAEYRIDWNAVEVPGDSRATVLRAQTEHGKFVATIRTREGLVTAYLLQTEDRLFICSDNMQWRRDYEAGLAK